MKLIPYLNSIDKRIIEHLTAKEYKLLVKFVKYFSINPKITYLILILGNVIIHENKYLINIAFLLVCDVCIFILKRIIRRSRPQIYNSTLLHKLSGLGPDSYSFPSAHTFTAFQLIPLSFVLFHFWGVLFIVYAIIVGSSRVILKHHYFTDVLTGMILGLTAGIINITLI